MRPEGSDTNNIQDSLAKVLARQRLAFTERGAPSL
jgi:hypothetical protein